MKPYYEHGGITIYLGDFREVAPTLGRVGHIITDPPYLTANRDLVRFAKSPLGRRSGIPYAPASPEMLNALVDVADNACLGFFLAFNDFDGVSHLRSRIGGSRNLFATKAVGCWAKGPALVFPVGRNTTAAADVDMISIAKHRAYRMARERRSFFSTPSATPCDLAVVGGKPLPLMMAVLANYSEPGDLVLDPFMGGGTTLVAAKETGRLAIGIKVDEGRCEIAAKRLAQEVLFPASGGSDGT